MEKTKGGLTIAMNTYNLRLPFIIRRLHACEFADPLTFIYAWCSQPRLGMPRAVKSLSGPTRAFSARSSKATPRFRLLHCKLATASPSIQSQGFHIFACFGANFAEALSSVLKCEKAATYLTGRIRVPGDLSITSHGAVDHEFTVNTPWIHGRS